MDKQLEYLLSIMPTSEKNLFDMTYPDGVDQSIELEVIKQIKMSMLITWMEKLYFKTRKVKVRLPQRPSKILYTKGKEKIRGKL